ncbi:hypothetical protein AcV5_007405 [Taiwanofungus camphoratus]|nr:hypothetical protein AcV5_007405 [Antrodia cinnamomea]
MNGTSFDDPSQIFKLHGISGKPGVPSSLRDATNPMKSAQSGSSRTWQNARPTPIQTPANGQRPSSSRQPWTYRSPYSNGRMGDNLHAKSASSNSGNHTARMTVIQEPHFPSASSSRQPNKRPRLEESSKYFPDSKAMNMSSGRSDILRNSRIPRYPEPITIEDDDDVGVPIQSLYYRPNRERSSSSPDPLNSLPDNRQTRTVQPHPQSVAPHAFERHSGDAQPLRALAPDGDATMRLRQRLGQSGNRDSMAEPEVTTVEDMEKAVDASELDEIQSASGFEERPTTTMPGRSPVLPTGHVQRIAKGYETPRPRELNLLKMDAKKPSSLKDKMRGKDMKLIREPVPGGNGDAKDPLTSTSGFIIGGNRKSTKKSAQTVRQIQLPLEAWSLGCCILKNDDNDTVTPHCWLTFSSELGGVISVRPSADGPIQYRCRLDRDVEAFTYTKAPYDDSVVIQMRTSRPTPHSKNKQQTPEFDPGSRGMDGLLTFKFITKHANWSNGQPYHDLVEALRSSIRRAESLIGTSAQSCWEQAVKAADWKRLELERKGLNVSGANESTASPTASDQLSPLAAKQRPVPRPTYKGAAAASEHPFLTTRKSLRLRSQTTPSPEPEELILVYPPSGAGAININRSDIKRLQPGQYLNDTLIEFGLKLWLADLRQNNPELAEQVHVFSSFFYKKLNVKNKEEGYQSVRKWTSKFDLFKKKYIVVPINEHFHWYLAIIHNPEHILAPPPPEPVSISRPMTRKRKRQSEAFEAEAFGAEATRKDTKPLSVECSPNSMDEEIIADSEGELEVERLIEPTRSCSIGDEGPRSSYVVDAAADCPDLMNVELEYPTSRAGSPEVMDVEEVSTDGNKIEENPSVDPSAEVRPTSNPTSASVQCEDAVSKSIEPSKFYASPTWARKGKEKATSPLSVNLDVDDEPLGEEADELAASETGEPERHLTYIFIFDSLGSKHPQAIKTLTRYLQLEAKDKKGLDSTSQAQGKGALVPSQPNYCDCGVYVLHFVRTFLKDPLRYSELILTTKAKGYPAEQRKVDWEGTVVDDLRNELTERITLLADAWKQDRLAKEELRKKEATERPTEENKADTTTPSASVVDASDDEIIIADVEMVSKPPSSKPASRIRPKAIARGGTKAEGAERLRG